jgi:hypothetical protein
VIGSLVRPNHPERRGEQALIRFAAFHLHVRVLCRTSPLPLPHPLPSTSLRTLLPVPSPVPVPGCPLERKSTARRNLLRCLLLYRASPATHYLHPLLTVPTLALCPRPGKTRSQSTWYQHPRAFPNGTRIPQLANYFWPFPFPFHALHPIENALTSRLERQRFAPRPSAIPHLIFSPCLPCRCGAVPCHPS